MISARVLSALAASVMLSMAVAQESSSIRLIPTPTVTLKANAMVDVGCFETGIPLENHGPYIHQSPGNCQFICIQEKKPVMALTDGENCWCGDYIPPESAKTNNGSCDTECGGTKDYKCTSNYSPINLHMLI
jgi:cell wall integrity and stress response component